MKAFLCFAFLAVLAVAWAAPSEEGLTHSSPAAENRDKRGLLYGDLGYGSALPSYGYNGYYGRSYGYGLPSYGYNYGGFNNIYRQAAVNAFW